MASEQMDNEELTPAEKYRKAVIKHDDVRNRQRRGEEVSREEFAEVGDERDQAYNEIRRLREQNDEDQ